LGILTTNGFYTQHSQNPNKNVRMEMVKVWINNVYNIFFKSSQLPPAIENLIEAPKDSSTQSFPCLPPNYVNHIQLE